MLRCEECDILKTLGNTELLRQGNSYTRQDWLEAICRPIGIIQEAALKSECNWICPPVQEPQLLPRGRHHRRSQLSQWTCVLLQAQVQFHSGHTISRNRHSCPGLTAGIQETTTPEGGKTADNAFEGRKTASKRRSIKGKKEKIRAI